jgi:hypothetical protein
MKRAGGWFAGVAMGFSTITGNQRMRGQKPQPRNWGFLIACSPCPYRAARPLAEAWEPAQQV